MKCLSRLETRISILNDFENQVSIFKNWILENDIADCIYWHHDNKEYYFSHIAATFKALEQSLLPLQECCTQFPTLGNRQQPKQPREWFPHWPTDTFLAKRLESHHGKEEHKTCVANAVGFVSPGEHLYSCWCPVLYNNNGW